MGEIADWLVEQEMFYGRDSMGNSIYGNRHRRDVTRGVYVYLRQYCKLHTEAISSLCAEYCVEVLGKSCNQRHVTNCKQIQGNWKNFAAWVQQRIN